MHKVGRDLNKIVRFNQVNGITVRTLKNKTSKETMMEFFSYVTPNIPENVVHTRFLRAVKNVRLLWGNRNV